MTEPTVSLSLTDIPIDKNVQHGFNREIVITVSRRGWTFGKLVITKESVRWTRNEYKTRRRGKTVIKDWYEFDKLMHG